MEEKEQKKSRTKTWIALVLGVAMVVLGSVAVIKDDLVNRILIELGAQQTAASTIEINPETAPVFSKAADVIEAAVQARHADPEKLAIILNEALKEYAGTTVDVSGIIILIIDKVNKEHEVSKTEEEYLDRVSLIAKGFKEAVNNLPKE